MNVVSMNLWRWKSVAVATNHVGYVSLHAVELRCNQSDCLEDVIHHRSAFSQPRNIGIQALDFSPTQFCGSQWHIRLLNTRFARTCTYSRACCLLASYAAFEAWRFPLERILLHLCDLDFCQLTSLHDFFACTQSRLVEVTSRFHSCSGRLLPCCIKPFNSKVPKSQQLHISMLRMSSECGSAVALPWPFHFPCPAGIEITIPLPGKQVIVE